MVKLLISYLSGAAMGATLLFPNFGPLVFFIGIPAFYIYFKSAAPLKFYLSFTLGLCMVGYFPAFYIRPGFTPLVNFIIDLIVYIVICVIHSLILGLILWLGFKYSRGVLSKCIFVPLLWAFGELIIGSGTFAWPTLRISLSLWKYPAFIGFAAIGGQLLISAIIICVNMLFGLAVIKFKSKKAFITALMGVLTLCITVSPSLFVKESGEGYFTAALVQPGVTVVGEDRGDVYIRALELSEEAAKENCDIILVSESVLPVNFNIDEYLQKQWADISVSAKADTVIGGRLNGHAAAYHFSSSGKLKNIAPKKREVPLFENGVGERKFRLISDNSPNILNTSIGDTGLMICYESMFPVIARNAAKQGATFLCVITNDSWFDNMSAKNLHLAHGVFRAVETGRPLLQSGINGRTAIVNKNGKVTHILDTSEGDVLNGEFSAGTKNTLYTYIGDMWVLLAFWIFAIYIRIKKAS